MVRALFLENPDHEADTLLRNAGIEVERHPGSLDEDELIEALQGVSVLGIRSKTCVTGRVLRAHPQLESIGTFSIGTKQIDLAEANRHGVAVFNAPFSNSRSVVELAIAEIIALNRRLSERDRALHEGRWEKTASGAHEVRGLTLGIVGYGNIGTQLSVMAEAIGMRVLFYDIRERPALGNARRCRSMEEVLRNSDVVSIHVDDSPSNTGLIGAEEFDQMRPGALFLNLSRGFVVDDDALRDNIVEGKIAGAALDVYPYEPKSNGTEFMSPLRGLPNVILTPHIGGSTIEAQYEIGQFVGAKLASYVRTGSTDMSVNLPRLTLTPSSHARYRVAWVHRNTPGVLAIVNQAFAEAGANITGQILGTSQEIGYMVTDLSSEIPPEALDALREMEGTIRLRLMERRGS
ncbi:MAG TPA: phosphoglycerate dehydrogenase [Actinomycetaceae bacterium]|nr:phosphoglycerate dehydrogenase [Actinomycetaceae bacterium]